jgi:hypothetical protein
MLAAAVIYDQRPFKSLFLVNGNITIYCGFTDNWVLLQHCCATLRAS